MSLSKTLKDAIHGFAQYPQTLVRDDDCFMTLDYITTRNASIGAKEIIFLRFPNSRS